MPPTHPLGRAISYGCAVLTLAPLASCRQSPTAASQSQRIAAMRRWATSAPASYDVTVGRSCECLPNATRRVVVSVRDGQVASRRYSDTGIEVPAAYAASYPTVSGMFAIIVDAEARHAAAISAQYDASFGFPASVSIDYDAAMVDDEIGWTLRDFRVP